MAARPASRGVYAVLHIPSPTLIKPYPCLLHDTAPYPAFPCTSLTLLHILNPAAQGPVPYHTALPPTSPHTALDGPCPIPPCPTPSCPTPPCLYTCTLNRANPCGLFLWPNPVANSCILLYGGVHLYMLEASRPGIMLCSCPLASPSHSLSCPG